MFNRKKQQLIAAIICSIVVISLVIGLLAGM